MSARREERQQKNRKKYPTVSLTPTKYKLLCQLAAEDGMSPYEFIQHVLVEVNFKRHFIRVEGQAQPIPAPCTRPRCFMPY